MKTIHILNGQVMYNHFKQTSFLKQERMIPFNEAMCYGSTSAELFSDEFIVKRAKVHNVTLTEYDDITLTPLQPFLNEEFSHVALWFDADMFCQLNILTILAWLDQNNHQHPIELHIVGDHFEMLEKYTLEVKGYYALYKQVLIDKTMPHHIEPGLLKKGVDIYLTYLNQDSDLMEYIHKNKNVSEKELVSLLLAKFKDYGLGDTQYIEIINKSRNPSK